MKLRDITYEDMPELALAMGPDCAAAICLINGYMQGREAFEKAKSSIPSEILDKELKVS